MICNDISMSNKHWNGCDIGCMNLDHSLYRLKLNKYTSDIYIMQNTVMLGGMAAVP